MQIGPKVPVAFLGTPATEYVSSLGDERRKPLTMVMAMCTNYCAIAVMCIYQRISFQK